MTTELTANYMPGQVDLMLGADVTTAPVAGTVETWQITVPAGLSLVNPSGIGQYRGLIGTEIVGFTSGIVTPGTHPWTMTRGLEGSAITTHASGAVLALDLTAGAAGNFVQLVPTTPQVGNIAVTGALTAGDRSAASVPTFHTFNGATTFRDSPANQLDVDDAFDVIQDQPLVRDNATQCFFVSRQGALNGHQYTNPAATISDLTATTAPIFNVQKINVTQFQVDADGVQVHGKFKIGSAVAHILGAYSGNAIPIYDEAGTLLGWNPLYA